VKKPARKLATIETDLAKAMKAEGANVIKIGKLLLEAKKQLEHGDWLPWLEKNWDRSKRTAENYMAAGRLAAKFATVANLKLRPTALYALGRMIEDPRLQETFDAVLAEAAEKWVDDARIVEIAGEIDRAAEAEERRKAEEARKRAEEQRRKAAEEETEDDRKAREAREKRERAAAEIAEAKAVAAAKTEAAKAEANRAAAEALLAGPAPNLPTPQAEPDKDAQALEKWIDDGMRFTTKPLGPFVAALWSKPDNLAAVREFLGQLSRAMGR
jgi:hypothetical protein